MNANSNHQEYIDRINAAIEKTLELRRIDMFQASGRYRRWLRENNLNNRFPFSTVYQVNIVIMELTD